MNCDQLRVTGLRRHFTQLLFVRRGAPVPAQSFSLGRRTISRSAETAARRCFSATTTMDAIAISAPGNAASAAWRYGPSLDAQPRPSDPRSRARRSTPGCGSRSICFRPATARSRWVRSVCWRRRAMSRRTGWPRRWLGPCRPAAGKMRGAFCRSHRNAGHACCAPRPADRGNDRPGAWIVELPRSGRDPKPRKRGPPSAKEKGLRKATAQARINGRDGPQSCLMRRQCAINARNDTSKPKTLPKNSASFALL